MGASLSQITTMQRDATCAVFNPSMTRIALFRSDFFRRSDPTLLTWCGWLVVAVAFSVPLGSALSNVLGGALLLTLIAAGGYLEHWQRWRVHPFALVTLILFAVIFLGASYSNAPSDEIRRALTKYSRLLYAPIAIAVLTDAQWRKRALLAWMSAMLITLVLSYVHVFWAFPFGKARLAHELDDHFVFKHHITQNVMMSVFFVAAFAEAWRCRTRKKGGALVDCGWFWVLLAIAAAVNILYFVHGRAGYVTLLVNLIVVAIVAFAAARDTRLRLAAGTLVAVAVVAALASDIVRERFHTAFSEVESSQELGIKTSIGQRMEYASKSIELVQARPVLGWGAGSYAMEYCRIAKSPEWCKIGSYNPHNQFLFFAVQFGLLGLATLIAWLITAGWVMRKLPLGDKLVGYSLLATLLVHCMLDSPLFIVTEGTWYPLMLGIFAAGAYCKNSKPVQGFSKREAASATASTDGHSG